LVTSASPTGPALTQCQALVAALPDTVSGQTRRDVQAGDGTTAAWGNPAIVLRCGVDKPKGFHRASPCTTVNGVDWWVPLTWPTKGSLVITTVGRSVYVEVGVPVQYLPPAATMANLSEAISSTTTVVRACV
jgi:hypothetical protein